MNLFETLLTLISSLFFLVHRKEELERLYKMAEQFDASGKKQMLPFKLLYRNRTSWEFEKIKAYGGNVMYASSKDASGDERSPINGKLKGLSFCPNVDAYTLEPPTMSPFGNTRLSIPFRELLDTCNLYFTDFYCMKATGPHYITLVAAEKDSKSDTFGKISLLPFDPREPNRFLYTFEDQGSVTAHTWIELFYTENIDLNTIASRGGVISTTDDLGKFVPGGIPKNPWCSRCNLT